MTEQSSVIELLSAVMRQVRSVKKKDLNSHFNFNFRGIDTVLDAVGPALRDHGIVVIPELREQSCEVVGKSVRVLVKVAYTFYGPKGDSITAVVPGEAMDSQDKASSKAMSVAFRTALIQALAIPTGERDPHAGAPVTTKMAKLREQAKKLMTDKEWSADEMADDYVTWSRGAEIGAADESDLEKYIASHAPTRTMSRARGTGAP